MKKINSYRLLAIDPGYDRLGWAIGQVNQSKFQPSAFGCIVTDKKQTIPDRYKKITEKLKNIIDKYQPKVLAIETVYFSNNKTTAMRVSEAKGLIMATCLEKQLEIREYNPSQIKSAVTGNGKADKAAIKKMVLLQLKGLDKVAQSKKILDDALDALAVGITEAAINKL